MRKGLVIISLIATVLSLLTVLNIIQSICIANIYFIMYKCLVVIKNDKGR